MMTTLRSDMRYERRCGAEAPRIQASEVPVYDLLDLIFRHEPHDLVDDLAALEQQQRGDAPHVELDRRLRVVVDIQLADDDFAVVVDGYRVNGGTQPLARATPLRPKVDQNRRAGFQYLQVEVPVG